MNVSDIVWHAKTSKPLQVKVMMCAHVCASLTFRIVATIVAQIRFVFALFGKQVFLAFPNFTYVYPTHHKKNMCLGVAKHR